MNTINQIINSCEWAPSRFFIFSDNVFDPLVYYSHLFPVVLSLLITGILFFRNRGRLANKILFGISILFSLWSIFDLILWATPNPPDTVFFWSLVNMLEPLIYVGGLYFIYSFIENKLPSLKVQSILFLLIIPVLILGHSKFNIFAFNLSSCDREAVEGILVFYNYLIEIIFSIWIIIYGIYKYKSSDVNNKKPILLCIIGLSLFLFSFAFGNIIGSLSENWILGQVGLFGLPIFIGFLAVLVGKYNSFKTRTFYAEILVIILWTLIISMFFIEDFNLIRTILLVTLIITMFIGYLLIKSVRRQINQKEKLEELNKKLKLLDGKKNEFLSLATHQLRSPLTSIKWGLDSIKTKYDVETVTHLERTAEDLIGTVNDLLDISKIEQGGMVVKKEEFDFLDFIGRIIEEFRMTAEKKNLKITFEFDNNSYLIQGDENKLRQVFINLIDNAIKYTNAGTINVSLKHYPRKAVVSVRDTGPGIAKEELALLFDKFIRGVAGKASSSGSGLGLYLAKKIVLIHAGAIYASSDGKGKGSTFTVELPLTK